MKKTLFLILTLAVFAASSGCKDDEAVTGIDFDVTFKATYNGVQLEKNTDYVFGTYPLQFIRYRLYLSDITLLKTNGEEVRMSEIEYLDFTPDSGSSDLSVTPKITFKNVPEGMYDGLRLGYGVKPSLNAKRPADFPTGHPLNIETDYWSGWKSYIFSVVDGKADPDNNGTKNLAFSYHCGSDPVYRTFSFDEQIVVSPDSPGIGLEFDVLKILTNEDGSLYNIEANPATSNSVNDVEVAKALMDHYGKATSIKQL